MLSVSALPLASRRRPARCSPMHSRRPCGPISSQRTQRTASWPPRNGITRSIPSISRRAPALPTDSGRLSRQSGRWRSSQALTEAPAATPRLPQACAAEPLDSQLSCDDTQFSTAPARDRESAAGRRNLRDRLEEVRCAKSLRLMRTLCPLWRGSLARLVASRTSGDCISELCRQKNMASDPISSRAAMDFVLITLASLG